MSTAYERLDWACMHVWGVLESRGLQCVWGVDGWWGSWCDLSLTVWKQLHFLSHWLTDASCLSVCLSVMLHLSVCQSVIHHLLLTTPDTSLLRLLLLLLLLPALTLSLSILISSSSAVCVCLSIHFSPVVTAAKVKQSAASVCPVVERFHYFIDWNDSYSSCGGVGERSGRWPELINVIVWYGPKIFWTY